MAGGPEDIGKAVLDDKIIKPHRNNQEKVEQENGPGNFIVPVNPDLPRQGFEEENNDDINKDEIIRVDRMESKIEDGGWDDLESFHDDEIQAEKGINLPVQEMEK